MMESQTPQLYNCLNQVNHRAYPELHTIRKFSILQKERYMNSRFATVPDKPHFPTEEEKVLAYWTEIDAFQKQLELSEGKPEFTFYDGPPFATGLPHYGHIAAGTIKDVVTRYATMKGHHVSRRFGWDCHGLPIEYEIDKIH